MILNVGMQRIIAGFFLLELVRPFAVPSISYALPRPGQPEFTTYRSAGSPNMLNLSTYSTAVIASWLPTQSEQQCLFTLSLTADGQEVENQYIINVSAYVRALQYLNSGIANDVYLHLPGQADSLAAGAATYLRQYGTTGRSTVLLTFPVPARQLRQGCRLTFRSIPFGLPYQQFIFSAHELRQARRQKSLSN